MPVATGQDTQGCYARWGSSGKKYRYKCGDKAGRERAKRRAARQGRAAHAHGYKSAYSTGYQGEVPTIGGDKNDSKSK